MCTLRKYVLATPFITSFEKLLSGSSPFPPLVPQRFYMTMGEYVFPWTAFGYLLIIIDTVGHSLQELRVDFMVNLIVPKWVPNFLIANKFKCSSVFQWFDGT